MTMNYIVDDHPTKCPPLSRMLRKVNYQTNDRLLVGWASDITSKSRQNAKILENHRSAR